MPARDYHAGLVPVRICIAPGSEGMATYRTVMANVRNGWALHDAIDVTTGAVIADIVHVTHVATGMAFADGRLIPMHVLWRDLAATVPHLVIRHGRDPYRPTAGDGRTKPHPLWMEFLMAVRDRKAFPGRCPRVPFWLPVGD